MTNTLLVSHHTQELPFPLVLRKFKANIYIVSILTLQEMQAHIDKINEMATVMRKAIEVDEGRLCEDEERIKQLEVSHTGWLYSRCLLKALTEY